MVSTNENDTIEVFSYYVSHLCLNNNNYFFPLKGIGLFLIRHRNPVLRLKPGRWKNSAGARLRNSIYSFKSYLLILLPSCKILHLCCFYAILYNIIRLYIQHTFLLYVEPLRSNFKCIFTEDGRRLFITNKNIILFFFV